MTKQEIMNKGSEILQGMADIENEKVGENKDVEAFISILLTSINHINNAITYKDNRYVLRMLKYLKSMRISIQNNVNEILPILMNVICKIFRENSPIHSILEKYICQYKDVKKDISDLNGINERTYANAQPEIEVFFYVLILIFLLDQRLYEEAVVLSQSIVSRIVTLNRRSLDYISAKVYFYYSYLHELVGKLSDVRQNLLNIYRIACLHRDIMTQAVILNLLLRDYIQSNLYELAVKFISKTSFPENLSSNAQYARYLYYLGKILAIQLDYSEAHSKITQAIRKAPQNIQCAKGFKLAATKMEIVVELLMGEIPARSIFSNIYMRNKLVPYKQLVIAVRHGDIHKFSQVMNNYQKLFQQDGVYFLIRRIHHNVIKTALRIINISYSRISIRDIGRKIGVDSILDVEGIIAKAIHDGVIDATIHYDTQYVESKPQSDVYLTSEPMKTFHKRIVFCLQLYSDAIKAMQYPDENEKKENEEAKERKMRQQEEIAQAEEGDMVDDDIL